MGSNVFIDLCLIFVLFYYFPESLPGQPFPFTLTTGPFHQVFVLKGFETSSNIPATHLRILNQSEQFFPLLPCCTLYIAFQGLHHPNQGNELRHSYSCCVKKLKHCLVPVSFKSSHFGCSKRSSTSFVERICGSFFSTFGDSRFSVGS